ncbi:MAG TPA: competence/damage-inducible protein A [Bacteroidales bacterium]|jgi:nicotinamide-nucleotide amidase|nr:competence/damage-inducible protein A [Bacteroidales bacterium]HNU22421.1 competence/damage-inducible protein A [Bacteroidales bacterium]HNV17521.1 competence/damage-inducible protein A [Bacteroidales bacterium]HNZ79691.1 competence/damage-inducible protein A [Bacteroidales bacterium]HOC15929.1 competence/damage-inducible protein A [Bacteroidales bacterium]
MKAEIITIGDEILIGQIIDTNSAWIANELNLIGIDVCRMISIADQADEIIRAVDDSFQRVDVIVMTGGLGPTSDDKTKQVLCDYFQTHLLFDEEAYKDVEKFFSDRNLEVNEFNRQQAMLPENAINFPNSMGTARGMWFTKDGKHLFSLPGVPYEMKAIMQQSVLPELKKLSGLQFIFHKTIMTTGIGEAFLAEKIHTWETELPSFIKLAYLPSPGLVRLRLSAKGSHPEIVQNAVMQKVEELEKIIPEYIYGFDDEPLEKVVGDILKQKEKTLCTAESCTGGYISHLITSIPGSSDYFKGGVVAYSNEIKAEILQVDENLLKEYGAVSQQVVEAMAINARRLLQSDFSIAVSGIAGPDGGTPQKPVGYVWIAVADAQTCKSEVFHFGNQRMQNIQRTALSALNLIRLMLIYP